jgi:hypothetical protein
MKRGIFLLVSLFVMVSTFGAIKSTKTTQNVVDFNPHYYSDESIEFTERGIKFYIFLDGQFDFNTAETADVDYIYRNRKGRRTKRYSPRGVRIERDYQGRIRRIGNVFISYTYDNKVKRIGTVFVKYRRDRMKKVGNLKIYYDRYGVRFVGNVKGYRDYYYNPYYSYGWSSFNTWNTWDTWEYGYYDPFFDNDGFYDDYESYDEDDNYYYYRSKSKSSKGKKTKKGKVIKRKKAAKSKRTDKRKKLKSLNKSEVMKMKRRK